MTQPKARVMVVDDTPASLYATSRVLRNAGFEVIEATTGAAAVELAVANPVDVIVLDIHLPGLDGYEVCRRIRTEADGSVRVVYLSASYVDDIHKVEGYHAGADGFLTSPVDPTVLVATVTAQLRTRHIEVQLAELLERERAAREDAEAANRSKDEFLATLSHELRNPLNAIVGWAEVARRFKPPAEIERALEVIVRNARLQTQLISDLLDVSRITTGKLALDNRPVAIAEVVTAVLDTLRSTAQQRGVRLETSIDRGVGIVVGDFNRLQQVVANLISNAIKFSDRDGVVTVTLRPGAGETAQLSVEDAGRGIEPEALPRIFERFWQAETSTRRSHSGLGLGLAIVKHLTEMHGGTVAAFSEGLGRGTRFVVTLPVAPIGLPEPGDVRPGSGATPDLSGLRVLVVDDDEDGRTWIRRLLIGAGAQAIDAGDVASALDAVDSFKPDVLISDLAMPHADGFDLLELLRSRGHSPERLPAIAISAFGDAEHQGRALGATFHAFLIKPPDPGALLAALAEIRPFRPESTPR